MSLLHRPDNLRSGWSVGAPVETAAPLSLGLAVLLGVGTTLAVLLGIARYRRMLDQVEHTDNGGFRGMGRRLVWMSYGAAVAIGLAVTGATGHVPAFVVTAAVLFLPYNLVLWAAPIGQALRSLARRARR